MSRNAPPATIVTEYAQYLSDDDLRFLCSRLSERYPNDLAEAITFMGRNRRVEPLLAASRSSWDLYDICDLVTDALQKEIRIRSEQ